MPRQPALFLRYDGSPAKAIWHFAGNIPPNWIKRSRESRKRLEDDVAESMKQLSTLRKKRPNAKVKIKEAEQQLRVLLRGWEKAYRKEMFYNGLRILLDLSREDMSSR